MQTAGPPETPTARPTEGNLGREVFRPSTATMKVRGGSPEAARPRGSRHRIRTYTRFRTNSGKPTLAIPRGLSTHNQPGEMIQGKSRATA